MMKNIHKPLARDQRAISMPAGWSPLAHRSHPIARDDHGNRRRILDDSYAVMNTFPTLATA